MTVTTPGKLAIFELVGDEIDGDGMSLDEAYAFLTGADRTTSEAPRIVVASLDSRPAPKIVFSKSEDVTVAAADVHTGAMIALVPTNEDAHRLALDGFEEAEQLHVTLVYLGDAADLDAEARAVILDVVRRYAGGSITARAFTANLFNPDGDEPCLVLGIGSDGGPELEELHSNIYSAVRGLAGVEVPENHTPWLPHVTLAYADVVTLLALLPQALERIGPVTFDRVRVAYGGEVTDVPLRGDADAEIEPLVAAGDHWKDQPRDPSGEDAGQWVKTPGGGAADKLRKVIPDDLSDLSPAGTQLGSRVGGMFTTPSGESVYVKAGDSNEQARREVVAAQLYRLAGLDAPNLRLGHGAPFEDVADLEDGEFNPDNLQIVSPVVPGDTELTDVAIHENRDAKLLSEIYEGFAVDAWLANWDVAGLGNFLRSADDKQLYRIDVGDSLGSGGNDAGVKFGDEVPELDLFTDENFRADAAELFADITEKQKRDSAKRVAAITSAQIRSVVSSVGAEPELADRLIARREYILKRYGIDDLSSGATAVDDFDKLKRAIPAVIYKKHSHGAVVARSRNGQEISYDAGANGYVLQSENGASQRLTKKAAYDELKNVGKWAQPGGAAAVKGNVKKKATAGTVEPPKVSSTTEVLKPATPEPAVPKSVKKSTDAAKLTQQIDDLSEKIAQITEASRKHRDVVQAMTHKAGKGGVLTAQDLDDNERARDKLADLIPEAKEYADEKLRLLIERDGAPWGGDAGDVPTANPIATALSSEFAKVRNQYVVNDRLTVVNNASLRGDNPTAGAKAWRTKMNKMVNSTKIINDSVVYRGAVLPPEVVMQLRPGATLTDKGIISTDASSSTAGFYADTRAAYIPGMIRTMFQIKVSAGMPGVGVGYGEFVFGTDSTLRILESKLVDGEVQVTAELIPAAPQVKGKKKL